MTWEEKEDTSLLELKYIGLKLLLLRKKIDENINNQLNFLSHHEEPKIDAQSGKKMYNYIIDGTHLIPI